MSLLKRFGPEVASLVNLAQDLKDVRTVWMGFSFGHHLVHISLACSDALAASRPRTTSPSSPPTLVTLYNIARAILLFVLTRPASRSF